jgi:hypothetical protein
MGIKVERRAGLGECTGGQIIGPLAHACTWPAAVVTVIVDDDGHGIWMDQETAHAVAMGILEAIADG